MASHQAELGTTTRGLQEAGGSGQETLRTLRALSQTCTRLRAFTLPLLWAILHVATIDELARLRETLRVSPHLARYARSFCFMWDMGDELRSDRKRWFEPYAPEEGSLLDFAFRNRTKLWRTKLLESPSDGSASQVMRKKRSGGQYWNPDGVWPSDSDAVSFKHNGLEYEASGECARKPPWSAGVGLRSSEDRSKRSRRQRRRRADQER